MKKITKMLSVIAMLLMTIAATQTATAQEPGTSPPVLETTRIWVNYNYALVPIEKTKVGMDALITHIQSLDKPTTQLEEYKNDLITKQNELKTTAEENKPLGQVISDMRHIVNNFREEARTQVGENTADARNAVKQALEENEDTFYDLIGNARSMHKQHNLEAFDHINERSEARIKEGQSKGIDVTELETALEEIKQKRTGFIEVMDDAIESCTVRPVRHCDTTEAEEYTELRDEIKQDYRDLRELARNIGKKHHTSKAIERSRTVIANAQSKLDNANADVTAEKATLSAISELIDSAENNHNTGNYDAAIEDLKSAKESFGKLRETVRSRRGAR